jgi:Tfp pilus assembly pilus retraction ATPase PilT
LIPAWARIAADLIAGNTQALRTLKQQGACDLSYSLPERSRFRVNVFRQRGTYAIVMRVIASKIPTLAELNLPSSLADAASLKHGIVLVTGPTGSGKSSTLAAIIDLINETRAEHILTIEDPIEFLHPHKKATVHQRELHSDTPTFALALTAMRTREYLEQGEAEGKTLLDAMRDGELDGIQHFDGAIEKLVRQGIISLATGLLYATNAGNLRVQLFDVAAEGEESIVIAP